MPEQQQKAIQKHAISITKREKLTASGIRRVDSFSDQLITAQTDLGQLNIKGEGLHIDTLNSETGDMLINGKITALSYTESHPAQSFFSRLFK